MVEWQKCCDDSENEYFLNCVRHGVQDSLLTLLTPANVMRVSNFIYNILVKDLYAVPIDCFVLA